MEATHFIEVYQNKNGGGYIEALINRISELPHYLKSTKQCRTLETVAVWRIKPTDVPLQERLEERERQRIKELRQIVSTITFLDPRDIGYSVRNKNSHAY